MERRGVATCGLILLIVGTARQRPTWIPATVSLYVTGAYWFTSSTSFANPAITVARSLSDNFARIAPSDVRGFVIARLGGAIVGGWMAKHLSTQGNYSRLPSVTE